MKNKYETTVLDIGGRYGMHTSWRPFTGDMNYFMFEPDREEADRLAVKYANHENISLHPIALGSEIGRKKLNILQHKAQNSFLEPIADHTWFSTSRPGEGDVIDSYDVDVTTVDAFSAEHGLSVDFMKIDTEGSEYDILLGADAQLSENVLAARVEANFDYKFKDIVLFPGIMELMMSKGFILLNFAFDAEGAVRNHYVDEKPWGTLVHCDSIWMKRDSIIFNEMGDDPDELAIRLLKCAAFCLINGPTDLAMDFLLRGKSEKGLDFTAHKDSKLFKFVDLAVQGLFEKVKRHPSQSAEELDDVYFNLFGRHLKLLHEYYESEEINPT